MLTKRSASWRLLWPTSLSQEQPKYMKFSGRASDLASSCIPLPRQQTRANDANRFSAGGFVLRKSRDGRSDA